MSVDRKAEKDFSRSSGLAVDDQLLHPCGAAGLAVLGHGLSGQHVFCLKVCHQQVISSWFRYSKKAKGNGCWRWVLLKRSWVLSPQTHARNATVLAFCTTAVLATRAHTLHNKQQQQQQKAMRTNSNTSLQPPSLPFSLNTKQAQSIDWSSPSWPQAHRRAIDRWPAGSQVYRTQPRALGP